MARTGLHCKRFLEAENLAVADVSEHPQRTDTVVWVDFCAPTKVELDELGLPSTVGDERTPQI